MATYTIRLNLGGDVIERLTRANALSDQLERKTNRMSRNGRGGGGGGGGVANYPNLRHGWHERMSSMYDVSRRFGNRHTHEDFMSDANRAFGSIRRFREQFVRNSFTPSGWMRNAGNLVGAVFDSAAAVIKSHPALLMGAGVLGTGAAAYALPKLIGGGLYAVLSKTLNSSSMTDAISNRMQMDMARRGLGSGYTSALSDATRMAAEYGYSRAGMLSMINTVSGFEIGGTQIGTAIATQIARQVGKVAQIGGRPYDIVGLNMQQLLAAEKPNMRDVRELIHAAPILNRYANEAMQRRGVTGTSPYNYLQDRANMLRALHRLDTELQPPSAAAARGQIALAKENFWINLAGMDKLWESVGRAGENMFDRISARLDVWYNSFDPNMLDHIFDEFVDGVEDVVSALTTLSDWILNFSDFIGLFNPWSWGDKSRWDLRHEKSAKQSEYTERRKAATYLSEELGKRYVEEYLSTPAARKAWGLDEGTEENRAANLKDARDILLKNFTTTFTPKVREGLEEYPGHLPAENGQPQYATGLLKYNYTPYEANNGFSLFNFLKTGNSRDVTTVTKGELSTQPVTFRTNPALNDREINENFNRVTKIYGEGGGASGKDTKKIEDLTKGSKSLIINFNAPIVQMPTQINTNATPESIMQTISKQIEEVTIRGLQIAFNNSTRTLNG